MIKLASPDILEEDINRVIDVLKSGNLVQNTFVKKLEDNISSYNSIPHVSIVSSATSALHLSLMALNIGKGGSVIVSAFTFPATANVVEIMGAETILCDVDINNYVISAEAVEKTILAHKSKNIKAIIVVHEFGFPAEIKLIAEIAKKYNLYLIEDAACAFGTLANGFHPGYYSDMACYSFHPRKAITSGEGGAVVSKNKEYICKVNSLRNHGIEYTKTGLDFIYAGLNYRMTDFQAALAIGQLERFNDELNKRKKLALFYYELLKNETKIQLPQFHNNHSWQSFMLLLNKKINRTQLIENLLKENIQTNLGAQAINCLTYYKNKYNFTDQACKNASILYNHGLVLPLYGKLSEDNIKYICSTLIKFLND